MSALQHIALSRASYGEINQRLEYQLVPFIQLANTTVAHELFHAPFT